MNKKNSKLVFTLNIIYKVIYLFFLKISWKSIMKSSLIILLLLFGIIDLSSKVVTLSHDNSEPKGNSYQPVRVWWEESTYLAPSGPCVIKSILIYYEGDTPARDTLRICWFPTIEGWLPTHYVWHYNTIIEPIVVEYSGVPGWQRIDVAGLGLRSDGFDKIVVQHFIKPSGPWFAYDSDGNNSGDLSWINNYMANDYGAGYSYALGDYMVRMEVEYDLPFEEGSEPAPAPKFLDVTSRLKINQGNECSVVD